MHSSSKPAVRFFFYTVFLGLTVGLTVVASARELIPLRLPPALLMISVFSPAIAAIYLTTFSGGYRGLSSLLRPILAWRVRPHWYATAILLPFTINAVALAVFGLSGHTPPTVPGEPPPQLQSLAGTPVLLYVNLTVFQLLGSLGEEIGWRGYALPVLQTSYGAMSASLVIGVVWTFWHVPFFLMPDTNQALVPWGWYALYVPSISVLFTWIYNNTQGSLLLVTLFHASIQAANVYFPIIEPPGLYALSVVVTVVVALVVIAAFGPRTLTRRHRFAADETQ